MLKYTTPPSSKLACTSQHAVLPTHYTLCMYTPVGTSLQPIPLSLNLQEPRTSRMSNIWRHHYGPGQRPCSTTELDSTGQRNLFQSCCLGSTSAWRESSLPRPAEQVQVVEILSCNALLLFTVANYIMAKYYFCSCVVWNVLDSTYSFVQSVWLHCLHYLWRTCHQLHNYAWLIIGWYILSID